MQAIQMQTAQTHQKFLETQTQAARTLQNMMENAQRLAAASMGIKTEIKPSDVSFEPLKQEISEQVEPLTGFDKTDYNPKIADTTNIQSVPPNALRFNRFDSLIRSGNKKGPF